MTMISPTVILQGIIYGLLNGSIYGLISIGFTMIFGVMKIVNFAYGQLTVVSMYMAFMLYSWLAIDPFVSVIVAMPVFFLLGLIIYKVLIQHMLKAAHHIQMIATLGFMIFLESIMLFTFKGTPRGFTTSYATTMLPFFGDLRLSVPRLMATAVSVAVILCLFLFLKKTTFGKTIEATADNEEGAMLSGIETSRVFMIAFATACMLEGIAGCSIMAFSVVDPYTGFTLVTKAFLIVVVAGLGSIGGAIVAGLMVGVIEALATIFISASLGTGILFLILSAVLVVRPSGLFAKATE